MLLHVGHSLWQILFPDLLHCFWRHPLKSKYCVVDPEVFGIVWQLLRPLVVIDQLLIKTREPESQRGEEGGETPEVVSILSDVLDQVSGYHHRNVLGKD